MNNGVIVMTVNETTAEELKPITDILESLGVKFKHQQLMIDVIQSHQIVWEQMKVEQRALALSSTSEILKTPTDINTVIGAKAHFESFFLTA